jgi:hypothetical protein
MLSGAVVHRGRVACEAALSGPAAGGRRLGMGAMSLHGREASVGLLLSAAPWREVASERVVGGAKRQGGGGREADSLQPCSSLARSA